MATQWDQTIAVSCCDSADPFRLYCEPEAAPLVTRTQGGIQRLFGVWRIPVMQAELEWVARHPSDPARLRAHRLWAGAAGGWTGSPGHRSGWGGAGSGWLIEPDWHQDRECAVSVGASDSQRCDRAVQAEGQLVSALERL
jgi:hypothetical protein